MCYIIQSRPICVPQYWHKCPTYDNDMLHGQGLICFYYDWYMISFNPPRFLLLHVLDVGLICVPVDSPLKQIRLYINVFLRMFGGEGDVQNE